MAKIVYKLMNVLVALPSEGLYPLRTLACVLLLFGIATLAHGSGFLAVFAAGIVLSNGRAPFKREIQQAARPASTRLRQAVVVQYVQVAADRGVRAQTALPESS